MVGTAVRVTGAGAPRRFKRSLAAMAAATGGALARAAADFLVRSLPAPMFSARSMAGPVETAVAGGHGAISSSGGDGIQVTGSGTVTILPKASQQVPAAAVALAVQAAPAAWPATAGDADKASGSAQPAGAVAMVALAAALAPTQAMAPMVPAVALVFLFLAFFGSEFSPNNHGRRAGGQWRRWQQARADGCASGNGGAGGTATMAPTGPPAAAFSMATTVWLVALAATGGKWWRRRKWRSIGGSGSSGGDRCPAHKRRDRYSFGQLRWWAPAGLGGSGGNAGNSTRRGQRQ